MTFDTSGMTFDAIVPSRLPCRGDSVIGGVPDATAATAMFASRSVIGAAPVWYAFCKSCWAIGIYVSGARPA